MTNLAIDMIRSNFAQRFGVNTIILVIVISQECIHKIETSGVHSEPDSIGNV